MSELSVDRSTTESIPFDVPLVIAVATVILASHGSTQGVSVWELLYAVVPVFAFLWVVIRLVWTRGVPQSLPVPFGILLIGLFLGWSVVSIVPAILVDVSVLAWGRRFAPVAVMCLMALVSVGSFRSIHRIEAATLFLAGLSATAVLVSLASAGPDILRFATMPGRFRAYAGGYFGPLAVTLAFPFLFQRGLIPWSRRAFVVVVLLIGITGTAISLTRTYWISTLVAITVAGVFVFPSLERPRHSVLVGSVGVAAAVFGVVVIGAGDVLLNRAATIIHPFESLSFLERVAELRGLLTGAIADPIRLLVGHGFGVPFTYNSVSPFRYGRTGPISVTFAHNYYAYLLWTTGVVGLSLFLGVLALVFRAAFRTAHATELDENVAPVALLGVLVNVAIASPIAPMLPELKWSAIVGVVFGLVFAGEQIRGVWG